MMHRTSSRVLLIVAAFALFLVPVAAIAAGGFEDVDDDNVFKADIAWLADVGVTKGCNPPTNTKFCPSDNVTREQMAAFMHRLAVNQVVDAKTAVDADKLDGKDSTAFLGKTEKAADADKLDGKDSSAFAVSGHDHDAVYLAKNGKAADADKLDGKDSSAFAQTSDVYTRAEIDSSTASALIAGGVVDSDGTVSAFFSSFGNFTTTRHDTGNYSLTFPGLAVNCEGPLPIVNVTGESGFVSLGPVGTSCLSGDVHVPVFAVNHAGTDADLRFNFTAYWTESGLSPKSAGER